ANQIPMMTPMISGSIVELHRAGKVRILAAASEERVSAAPEIPTAREQGFPDLIAQLFMGLFAPSGTPKPILSQITQATQVAMKDRDFQEKLVSAGFEPVVDSNPERTAAYIKEEIVRWTPVLKTSGMKPG